ncbi:class I SAM-dependent methyltransferase [Pseudocolwellia agarivorans]|uniref:class I SAM-dependent methyltransferase n=1 Tax=Pseudocolwellia agarivorans TaxID=1911682 RepID=UPI000987604A|nr:class I SAM-dependent methyltransferase [Pseudocolwellia agarivorans]
MKPALAFRKQRYPKGWEQLPNGKVILDEINQVLARWTPKFFGYHLLKIGALSGEVDCSQSTIKHQVTIDERSPDAAVISDIDDLPFLEHSVDVCLLSHVLEFTGDPHHVVREANRVLIPNGYLVITGYNPFSLAGLNSFIPYRRQKSPWNERFFSSMRVKDWLHLMGYEILADEHLIHSSLAGTIGKGKLFSYWQRFANNFLPQLGSVYIIVAKKRVLPLTPIKPKWKLRPKFSPVKVTGMSSSHKTPNKT